MMDKKASFFAVKTKSGRRGDIKRVKEKLWKLNKLLQFSGNVLF
jgi:hypothetical protein